MGLVYDTTSFGHTIVNFLVLHRALEESLARFTSQEAVVVATHFVPAGGAEFF